MNKTPDIQLKSIKYSKGPIRDMVTASLYLDSKKVGEVLDDGWLDEGMPYIEFISDAAMKKFMNTYDSFYKHPRKKYVPIEEFIQGIIDEDMSKHTLTSSTKNVRGRNR